MRTSKHRLPSGFVLGTLLLFISLSAAAQSDFGSVNIGSTTTSTVTVTIPHGGTLSSLSVVTQGAPNMDFTDAGGGTCATGIDYAANATCTVQVAFKPRYPGWRYGAVVLANSTGVLATAYLKGQGIGPQTIFLPGTQSTMPTSSPGYFSAAQMAADGNGNLYIASSSNSKVLKETPSSGGYIDSTIVDFQSPAILNGVAIDGAGNVYYSEFFSKSVVKETLNAGKYTPSTVFAFDSSIANSPNQIGVDGSGNVFFTDRMGELLEEKLSGETYSQSTISTGLWAYSRIAVDGGGNVYVDGYASSGSFPGHYVLKESPTAAGYVETVIKYDNQMYLSAFALDGMGNLYLGDANAEHIVKETLSGGDYTSSAFLTISTTPWSPNFGNFAIDSAGNFYLAGDSIVKVDLAEPPNLSFIPTVKGNTSTDSPRTVTLSNFGNEALNISALSYPLDFPEAGAGVGDCASGTSLPVFETCVVTVDFSPSSAVDAATPNYLSEAVSVTTNTMNSPATQQNITLSGIESLTKLTAPAPVFSVPSGNYSNGFQSALTDAVKNAVIHCTYDSSTPTASTYPCSSPVWINFFPAIEVTVKAIATAPGYDDSPVTTVTYKYSDFGFQVAPQTLTVNYGSQGTLNAKITPVNANGFSSPVSFSCPGLAYNLTCSFSPATVTPGTASASTTLTVTVNKLSANLHRNPNPFLPASALAVALCGFGLRKRRRMQMLLLLMVSMVGASLISSCAIAKLSGNYGGDDPGLTITAQLTVTATSGTLTHSTTFSLTEK